MVAVAVQSLIVAFRALEISIPFIFNFDSIAKPQSLASKLHLCMYMYVCNKEDYRFSDEAELYDLDPIRVDF